MNALNKKYPLTVKNGKSYPQLPIISNKSKIKAKNRKSLKFGGSKSPHYAKKVSIPARPWLGINSENKELLLSKAKNILSSQIKQILR